MLIKTFMLGEYLMKRPSSICQYIISRLLGQTSPFNDAFLISRSVLGIERQGNYIKQLPESLGAMLYF